MKVMKFGGTSVGKPERMKHVAELVMAQEEPVLLVLSALSGTTNALVNIGEQLAEGNREKAKGMINDLKNHYDQFVKGLLIKPDAIKKAEEILSEHFEFLNIITRISFSGALKKDILAQGELMSTKLFSVYLEECGVDHALLPALEFMSIDANDEPKVEVISARLKAVLEKTGPMKIYVTQGYICRNARGEVDNLKRGGSDYTASLVAAAIHASVCEIWTDIDGMHNNDPRVVEGTHPVEVLSFDEAAELAYFGAKILHPASIWPAQQYNIPVKLLNTMDPRAKGTMISAAAGSQGVKAVAAKDGIIAIKIKSSRMLLAYGFLRKVFEVFEKYRTSIDMITTSEVAVSLTIDDVSQLDYIIRELKPFGAISVEHNQTIIAVVGQDLVKSKDLLENLFSSLNGFPVRMVSYGGSNHNVSILLPSEYKAEVLKRINKGIFKIG